MNEQTLNVNQGKNLPVCDHEGCDQIANRAVIVHGEKDTIKKYCIAHVPRGVALFDIFSLEPLG